MVAHRSSEASNNGAGATTITMDKPSGVQDGDTMLMGVTSRGGTGVAITPPAVYTSVTPTYVGGSVGFSNAHAVYSPDGRYLWYGYSGTSGELVVRLDCLTNSEVAIDISDFYATLLAMSEDGAYVYAILGSVTRTIKVIDTATLTVVATVNRNYGTPSDALVVGSNLYIANNTANGYVEVWAITASSPYLALTEHVAMTGADGISYSLATDGTYLYVGSVSYHVTVMTLSDRSIVTSLDIGTTGSSIIMAVTPDLSKVWCTTRSGDTLARAFSTSTHSWNNAAITLDTSGWSSEGIVVTADGLYVYITGTGSTYLYCVNSAAETYRGAILGGFFENNPQTDPDGQHVWVLEYNHPAAAEIKRVRCSTNTVVDTFTVSVHARSMKMSPNGRYLWAWGDTTMEKFDLWAPLGFPVNSTTVLKQHIWWKIADSESSSYSVRLSASNLASGVIVALDSTVSMFEPEQYGGQANASSTSVVAPGVGTWSSADGVDVGIFGTAYGTTFTPPTNYTEPATADDHSTGTTAATASEGAYRALTGVTSVGSITATAANAAVNIGHHIFVSQNLLVNRFTLAADPTSISIARGTEDTLDVNSTLVSGNAEDITLDSIGEPAGVTISFGTNPITAGNSSVMTVALSGSVTEADHVITISGTTDTFYAETTFTLSVYSNPAPIPVHFLSSTM